MGACLRRDTGLPDHGHTRRMVGRRSPCTSPGATIPPARRCGALCIWHTWWTCRCDTCILAYLWRGAGDPAGGACRSLGMEGRHNGRTSHDSGQRHTHLLAALCARQPKGLLWWGNFQPRFLARLGRENAYVLLQSSYPSKPSIQPRTNTVAPNHSRTFCPQKPIVPGVPHLLVDHLQHLGLCFYQFLRLGIIHVFQCRCTDPKVLVWLRAPNQRVETIPVGQSPKFHTGSVVV